MILDKRKQSNKFKYKEVIIDEIVINDILYILLENSGCKIKAEMMISDSSKYINILYKSIYIFYINYYLILRNKTTNVLILFRHYR